MATKTTTTKKVAPKKISADKEAVTKGFEAAVYNQAGENKGTINLPEKVFGLKWNQDLVHQVSVSMMANQRAGTAHTKTRADVSGGGKKPWKQKGTGRARHGSSRSPIWIKGGVTFGPRSDKDYSKKINKKMRTKALFTVLSKKFKTGNILFIDSLSLSELKTKNAQDILSKLSAVKGFERLSTKKKTAALLAIPNRDEKIEKSFRNIPSVTISQVQDLNLLDALKFNSIILVGAESIKQLESKLK